MKRSLKIFKPTDGKAAEGIVCTFLNSDIFPLCLNYQNKRLFQNPYNSSIRPNFGHCGLLWEKKNISSISLGFSEICTVL